MPRESRRPPPKPPHHPPHPPHPPVRCDFRVVVQQWVLEHRREFLRSTETEFATLAEAKASLTGKLFFIAKIYHRNELVDTVRGTQTKHNPIS